MISLDDLVDTVHSAVDIAASSLMAKNIELLSTFFEMPDGQSIHGLCQLSASQVENLRPKFVNVSFPRETDQGPIEHTVSVPLISLVPISNIQIDELSFKTALEVSLQNDQVMCAFAPTKTTENGKFVIAKKDNKDAGEIATNSELNIVIKQKETPDGLKKLIEGYDKVLRAQIPN